MRPNADCVLGSLKDFQRVTVEYAFRRLWLDDDQVTRFLVADEVGLGKTMVAKGVIAKTVDHLWDSGKPINIVYICSNGQIARQNLGRLNEVGGSELRHADRLTLLPKVIGALRDQRINFVSFTPDTSFRVDRSSGRYAERVLLYWMLAACWGARITSQSGWKRFFEDRMSSCNFEYYLTQFDMSSLDEGLCQKFAAAIDEATGPGGGPLQEELEACAKEFDDIDVEPGWDIRRLRRQLIGSIRQLVARAAVSYLQPSLVILDEFQRFRDLLDAADDNDGAQLANAILEHPGARVLLLSATPYKMYTLPDEPDGDDHYQDFTRTVRFLAGPERARLVERNLRVMREYLAVRGDARPAQEAHDRVEHELRRVMSRTERLSSTPNRDGMLGERHLDGVELTPNDLRAWCTFSDVARQIDRHDVFEYWRSSPYPLNLMEQHNYQIRAKFQNAAERKDPAVTAVLESAQGLLDWDDIQAYRHVDPGNAKMRGLSRDVLGRGTWRLAWLPPSLPYYQPVGAYADPELRSFTKRLIFSAWTVVPKAIAVLMSYEAERLAVSAAGLADRGYEHATTPPLQFRVADNRAANMPVLALLYPSLTLAREGDSLEIARLLGGELPVGRDALMELVRDRMRVLLGDLPQGSRPGAPDPRWYWAAPFLLDRSLAAGANEPFLGRMREWDARDEEDHESRLAVHLQVAGRVSGLELGPQPGDLAEVLATMAIAGPGVCALRALSRVTGGAKALPDPDIRYAAYRIAQGLRSFFNKPEIVILLRSGEGDESYWRAVLDHAMDGCLQAVLDEYAHMLIESEGLQSANAQQRAWTLAGTMTEALTTRTAPNAVANIRVIDGEIRVEEDHRVGSHFAARYGRAQSDQKAASREAIVRTAFNSPFRPFVLASTSIGQEGLDFHVYSHAVVHWNLPSNPVDLEQREGRVHRYKGHAVRKNVADQYRSAALDPGQGDPWEAMFAAACSDRADEDSDIKPFWIFTRPGGAVIERYVPALPLSREAQQYERLLRTVGAYRFVIGQPRQEDLIRYAGEDVPWLQIDLAPSSPAPPHATIQS